MANLDPADAIQLAVVAALTTSADMIAAFGGTPAVWDRVPVSPDGTIDTAHFPYLTIGEDQVLGETTSCGDSSEIHVKVEVWSRSTNKHEVKTIAAAARRALSAYLTLAGHACVTWRFTSALYRREADGLTDRAILMFRYQTNPTP